MHIIGRPIRRLPQISASNTRLAGAYGFIRTNGRASTAVECVNTLHNDHVVKELIQLTVGLDAEIIANSHWTEDLT